MNSRNKETIEEIQKSEGTEQNVFTLPQKRSICSTLSRQLPENVLPTIQENIPIIQNTPDTPNMATLKSVSQIPASTNIIHTQLISNHQHPSNIAHPVSDSIVAGSDVPSVSVSMAQALPVAENEVENNVQHWLGIVNAMRVEDEMIKDKIKEKKKQKELMRKEEKLKKIVKNKIARDEKRFQTDKKKYEKKRDKLMKKEEKLRRELAEEGIYVPPVSESEIDDDDFITESEDWSSFSSESDHQSKNGGDEEFEDDGFPDEDECVFETDETLRIREESKDDPPKIRIIQHDSSSVVARKEKIDPGRIDLHAMSEEDEDYDDCEDPPYYNSDLGERMEQVKQMSIEDTSVRNEYYQNDILEIEDETIDDYYNEWNQNLEKHSIPASQWSKTLHKQDDSGQSCIAKDD